MMEWSFFHILEEFIQGFFIPQANAFRLGKFLGMSVYDYLYITFLIVSTLAILSGKKKSFQAVFFKTGIIIFVLAVFLQTIGQSQIFRMEFETLHNKSLSERNAILLDDKYLFIKQCRDSFPGYHRAQLITDMDITKEPGMYNHRAISYHLYPVDIRFRKDAPVEAIVAFRKNHARESIPDNFRVLIFWDDNNIFAVRKDLLK